MMCALRLRPPDRLPPVPEFSLICNRNHNLKMLAELALNQTQKQVMTIMLVTLVTLIQAATAWPPDIVCCSSSVQGATLLAR